MFGQAVCLDYNKKSARQEQMMATLYYRAKTTFYYLETIDNNCFVQIDTGMVFGIIIV